MNPKEQEIAIGELEERVDRLRNIYEQYFLGFEKLEPTVPRKDVERRVALLRKEQIRNTALRFRFHVVTQKYTTYATHWVRICRQIEEGTYKRHIRKAKARFSDGATRPERDVSIDIDLGDFDDLDMSMDDALAEADAAAVSYPRDASSDTVPPPATGRQTAPPYGTRDPSTPPPPPSARAARGPALPPGSKPLVLRRRDDTEQAPSQPQPAVAPASHGQVRAGASTASMAGAPPAQRMAQGAPNAAPRLRPMKPASEVRGPAPSSPGVESASSSRFAAATPQAGVTAAGPVPVAAPAASTPRLPAAPPPAQASSTGRLPAAPPSGAPSVPRMPVLPMGRPAPPPPSDSRARLPASPAAGPPSDPRTRTPGAAGPPPSVPKLPPTSLPRPVPAAPRAPMPPLSDHDAVPPMPSTSEERRGVRPRAPLLLPSQIARPTKKDE